jgi:hypothetical protein
MDITERTRRIDHAGYERITPALLLDVFDDRAKRVPPGLPTLPTVRLPEHGSADSLRMRSACLDDSGRLHNRALFKLLGWEPGYRVEVDVVTGGLAVYPTERGRYLLDARHGLSVPAAARRMAGIDHHNPVILVAAVRDRMLLVHSERFIAGLLRDHYQLLAGADDAT